MCNFAEAATQDSEVTHRRTSAGAGVSTVCTKMQALDCHSSEIFLRIMQLLLILLTQNWSNRRVFYLWMLIVLGSLILTLAIY